MNQLIDKFHTAYNSRILDLEKDDLVENIFEIYKNKDKRLMNELFKEYTNFLFRGSTQSEEAVFERARGNIRFISYAASLMDAGSSLFEAMDKAAKQSNDLRNGPIVDFLNDSIKDYAFIKLEGFRIMYNGALYSRKISKADSSENSAYEFLVLSRYTVPSEKKIIGQLQQNRSLKEKDCLEFLASQNLVQGMEYLDLAFGRIPTSFLNSNIKNIKGLSGYESALRHEVWKDHPKLGIQWILRSLPYGNGLLSRGSVSVESPPADETQDAEKTIDAVYAAISSRQHFNNIFDSSVANLEFLSSELERYQKEISETEKILKPWQGSIIPGIAKKNKQNLPN